MSWFYNTVIGKKSVLQLDIISIPIKCSGRGDTNTSHKACLNIPTFIKPALTFLSSLDLMVAHVRASPMDFGMTVQEIPYQVVLETSLLHPLNILFTLVCMRAW